MAKSEFVNKLSRNFHKFGLQLKKHSPEILVVTGVVGVVASAVMACKATTKLDTVLSDTKEKTEAIHTAIEKQEVAGEVYTKEDGKKDLVRVYTHTGLELVKLYGPAVLVGAASISSILMSHNIIRKRNIALAAAYSVVDGSFKDYRKNVIERFGKELDKELRYNIKTEEVETKVVDEKGKEKTVKETVEIVNPNTYSDYARFFDCGNPGWHKNPEYTLMFLKQQQAHANDMLKLRGHLFLNEVYEMLGIKKTSAGQVVGWVYDEVNPVGDNFVDFGIYDLSNPEKRRFVNGDETAILLDFNVDGPVYQLLG